MSEGKTEAKYGPERGKQVAYAIATQQAHKLGKTPKKKGGYGTPSGRSEAKAKYDRPAKAYKKTASMAGPDLRKPFMGGTQFPTLDSKSLPMQKLRASQKAAEVGPVPTPKQLRPKGFGIKYGADMSDDPLIQYLRKSAAVLDDNLEDMPTGADEKNLTSECPMPSGEACTAPADDKKLLGQLFSHPSKEAKYLARMHPVSSGSVDRVLKRH
jgi:hypothetical protein